MSTGGSYIHTLSPMMVRYYSTGMMTARFALVRPSLKWSEFRPTRIPTMFSSRLSMPSCVISLTIRVIFFFWSVDCFLDRDGSVGGIRHCDILVMFLIDVFVKLFKLY